MQWLQLKLCVKLIHTRRRIAGGKFYKLRSVFGVSDDVRSTSNNFSYACSEAECVDDRAKTNKRVKHAAHIGEVDVSRVPHAEHCGAIILQVTLRFTHS